jgi:hypothetical protein
VHWGLLDASFVHCSNNAGVFMKQFVASEEGIEYMFTVHDLGTNPELFLPLKFFFPYRLNEFLKAILIWLTSE